MASVFKRSGATTWTVKWTDATGRERQRRTRFTTKAEAYRLAQDLERKVERQVLGLEPVPAGRPRATFGELMDWYHERHGKRLRSQTYKPFMEKHFRAELGSVPLVEVTAERFDRLLSDKEDSLSAESVNKLRARAYTMFERARLSGTGLWAGPNPIDAVPKRKVPHRLPVFFGGRRFRSSSTRSPAGRRCRTSSRQPSTPASARARSSASTSRT